MPVIARIAALHDEMTAWRRDIHAHPELSFEEERTAALVAEKLRAFGVDEIHEGIARTGVVGTIRAGTGNRAIGLRADMDALPLQEKNQFAHRSRHDGKMHACGHDGHTTMLLGAAKYLSETRGFDGAVHLIFQPAEEGRAGGKAMVEAGLFERFPVEAVYGLHNKPGIATGRFSIRSGPMMAAVDLFDIHVSGKGAHSAKPETGVDAVLTASHIVVALQSIVSRNVSPLDTAVVSVTQVHGGDAYNVIPEEVVLRGTVRAYRPEVLASLAPAMRRVIEGVAASYGARARLDYRPGYPPVVNHAAETCRAADAAADVVGEGAVDREGELSVASEDFAFMLQACPGAFIFLGNGDGEGACQVHNPNYDFNDEILPIGASWFARLVELGLPRRG
jgi:hippurate hydrolase